MNNPIKPILNYFDRRSFRKYQQEIRVAREYRKSFDEVGIDGYVSLVEPGTKRNLIDRSRNSTSYYELEHRYAVHIWVYSAVNAIAEKSAMPPLVIKDPDGEMMDTPLPSSPNDMHTWDELEQLIAVYLELTGNAYVYHDKEEDMYFPLRPSRVRVVPRKDGRGVLGYGYNRHSVGHNGTLASALRNSKSQNWMHDDPEVLEWTKSEFETRLMKYHGWGVSKNTTKAPMELYASDKKNEDWIPLEPDEVLHFKYASPTHDFYGIPPIYPLITTLTTELYARQWNKTFFENGAIPPGMLVIPKVLPPDQIEKIRNKFAKQYGGSGNRGKPVVIQGGEQGATYQAFPNQHKDLEFLAGLNMGRDETLAVFGVPAEVIPGASTTASHSSSLSPATREKRKIFWQDTIAPKLKMRASRWTAHFKDDIPEGYEFGHDFSEIEDLKPDYAEKTKAARNAVFMTVGEVRSEIYGLPENPDAPILVPSNMMLTTIDGQQALPKPDEVPMDDSEDDDEMREVLPDVAKAAD